VCLWTPPGRHKRLRQTKEHLATNGRGRDEDPTPHLGYHPEAGQEQTVEQ